MISARPVTAARGSPPAMPLAVVIRSGTMPKCSLANIAPVRAKPVWISSAMKTTSFARHQSTSAGRNPSAGTMKPPSPWIGSMMIGREVVGADLLLDDRDGLLGGIRPAQSVAERVRHRRAVDLGRERAEAALVRHRLGGQGHREVRAAVVAVVERDDRLLLRELAGDLDGVLDGLGARVEQGALLRVVARGDAVERLGDGDVRLVRRDHEAGVGELGDLRLHGRDDLGVRVAERGHGDARAEVDERVAVGVDDDSAAGGDSLDRHGVTDAGGDGGGLAREQLLRAGPGDARDHAPLLRKRGSAQREGAVEVSVAVVLMVASVERRMPRPHAPSMYILGVATVHLVQRSETAWRRQPTLPPCAHCSVDATCTCGSRAKPRTSATDALDAPDPLGAQLRPRRPDPVPLGGARAADHGHAVPGRGRRPRRVPRLRAAPLARGGGRTRLRHRGRARRHPAVLAEACRDERMPLFEVPYRTPVHRGRPRRRRGDRGPVLRAAQLGARRAEARSRSPRSGPTASAPRSRSSPGSSTRGSGMFDAAGTLTREHPSTLDPAVGRRAARRGGRRAAARRARRIVAAASAAPPFTLQTLGRGGHLRGVIAIAGRRPRPGGPRRRHRRRRDGRPRARAAAGTRPCAHARCAQASCTPCSATTRRSPAASRATCGADCRPRPPRWR